MTVWDVADERIDELGATRRRSWISSATATSVRAICRTGPTICLPWCMATTRDEVEAKASIIAELLGDASCGHEILYSTRILKKTGLRIGA